MPGLRVRIVPADALAEGIAQIKRDAKVPDHFPADVLAEADAAAAAPLPERERVDLDFVTIDPPGARDLDQAMPLARTDGGYRISYAIADPAVFVKPGGALDRDTHERGVTVYAPDGKVPLQSARDLRGRRLAAARRVAARRAVGARPRRRRAADEHAGDPQDRAQRRPAHLRGRAGHARAAAEGDRREADRDRARARRGAALRPRAGGRPGGGRLDDPLPAAQPVRGLQRADLAAHRDGGGGHHAQGG